jgi:hypothetical protein
MCKYGLKINGDPTKDIPWFYVPTDVARKAKRTGVEAVDTPAAKYCLELIDRGLIHLDSASLELKPGNYTISEDGERLFRRINLN